MKNDQTRGIPGQILVGGCVVLFGLLFLLDNLDILDFNGALFLPAMLCIVGIAKLLDSKSDSGRLVAIVLIAAGSALAAKQFGFIYLDFRTFWPLILIVVGAAVIYKAIAGRRARSLAMPAKGSDDSVVDVTAILGGFERRITTQHFRGGEVTAIMGGCELDMRGSSIDGEAVLNVFAAMGGISVKVPPDWTVVLHGTPILGGFEEKTIAPPNDSKRLIVQGYAIMGGVEFRN